MARALSKNNWALFLLILAGIVVGSFLGHLAKDVSFLNWLNYGMDFAIGDANNSNIVTLNLGVLVLHFGFRIKVTIGSVIGVVAAVFIYKKI
ncbi:MAG: putative rane protein [Herbinix sp.]|nr:putative rane protein [Herbinix sp.]